MREGWEPHKKKWPHPAKSAATVISNRRTGNRITNISKRAETGNIPALYMG